MALEAKLGDYIPLGSPNDDRTPRGNIVIQPIERCRQSLREDRRRFLWNSMMAARYPKGIAKPTVVLKSLPNCDSELFRRRMARLRRNPELGSVMEEAAG